MLNDRKVFVSKAGTANNRRIRLWELPEKFHCSIVGTCLTLEELRRFARRAKIFPQTQISDYELHRAFVGMAGEPGFVSRLVQKHLDRKYQRILQQLATASDLESSASLWDEAVASGEVTGAYWALLTHPDLPDGLLQRAYGEVHMMSHLSGAACRVDMRQLAVLRVRMRQLEEQFAEANATARRKAAQQNQTICSLNARLASSGEAEQKLQEAEAKLHGLENGEVLDRLRTQVEEYAALLADARARAERAEATAEEWKHLALENGDRHLREQGHVAELQSERDALEAVLETLLAPDCSTCQTHEEAYGNIDLCNRCILYVGGRDRQCARFRTLVERQNGRFLHHDGGRQRLGSLLTQADEVLCPVDCVSHDAANRVKQFCKLHGKRLVFLPRASLAAFTRGLYELAA